MRDMNRRLALTVAGSTALVAITASAAVAANLGILTASSSSDVGQLDATRVAELAVATPASIEATRTAVAPAPAAETPAPTASTSGSQSVAQPAPRSGAAPSAPMSTWTPSPSPVAQTPIEDTSDDQPTTPPTQPSTHHSEDDESEEMEGSLDDAVEDDAIIIESPHQVEVVTVSEIED